MHHQSSLGGVLRHDDLHGYRVQCMPNVWNARDLINYVRPEYAAAPGPGRCTAPDGSQPPGGTRPGRWQIERKFTP